MQVAHRHCFDPFGGEGANGRAQRSGPERRRCTAAGSNTLAHRQAQMARHEGVGRRLAQRVAVVLEPFAHLQDVAVPLGGQQGELRSLALEQCIGRDRGAVDDALGRGEERGPVAAERGGEQLQPGEYADGLVLRRRGGLRGRDPTVVVDGDEIGERASNVDSDSVAGHCGPPCGGFGSLPSSRLVAPVTNSPRRSRRCASALRSSGSPQPPPPPERT